MSGTWGGGGNQRRITSTPIHPSPLRPRESAPSMYAIANSCRRVMNTGRAPSCILRTPFYSRFVVTGPRSQFQRHRLADRSAAGTTIVIFLFRTPVLTPCFVPFRRVDRSTANCSGHSPLHGRQKRRSQPSRRAQTFNFGRVAVPDERER